MKFDRKQYFIVIIIGLITSACNYAPPIVFQTDFGLKDGAVSSMKGVALTVDPDLKLYDLTHEIEPYNIWEAAYRLDQTAIYWPKGTVFVSVVDPGVGTQRRSIVMKSKTGHYFVTPDNGTLTLVAESMGIESIREINEKINRRKGSGRSYTFHGRDVYAFTAARLASGLISFEKLGAKLPDSVQKISYQKAILRADSIMGNIPILDIQYGNVWTNIPDTLLKKLSITAGEKVMLRIFQKDSLMYKGIVPFSNTFGDVPENNALAYVNSLMNFSVAVNKGNFADSFKIKSGPEWSVIVKKAQ